MLWSKAQYFDLRCSGVEEKVLEIRNTQVKYKCLKSVLKQVCVLCTTAPLPSVKLTNRRIRTNYRPPEEKEETARRPLTMTNGEACYSLSL